MKVTVIIGSNGPKISSDIIAASSGGSTKMVGSINLHEFTGNIFGLSKYAVFDLHDELVLYFNKCNTSIYKLNDLF